MIDRPARDNLAENIRHLAAGVISNDEFEERTVRRSFDPAILAVFLSGPWQLYSDFSTQKLRGKRKPPTEVKRSAARWILFLKTDLPYEWPRESMLASLSWLPLHILTLGLSLRLRQYLFSRHGDISVWPFIRKSDLAAARDKHGQSAPQ